MSDMIAYIGQFHTQVLIPFLTGLFSESVGIMFVSVAIVCVVFKVIKNLVQTKF